MDPIIQRPSPYGKPRLDTTGRPLTQPIVPGADKLDLLHMGTGGSLKKGVMHLVGEEGPELIVPNTKGGFQVIPHDQTMAIIQRPQVRQHCAGGEIEAHAEGGNILPDYDMDGWHQEYGAANLPEGMHYTDKYKYPNHMTFSSHSKYSSPEQQGGEWQRNGDRWTFNASPYNLTQHSPEEMQAYFREHEPDSTLNLPSGPYIMPHAEGGDINPHHSRSYHWGGPGSSWGGQTWEPLGGDPKSGTFRGFETFNRINNERFHPRDTDPLGAEPGNPYGRIGDTLSAEGWNPDMLRRPGTNVSINGGKGFSFADRHHSDPYAPNLHKETEQFVKDNLEVVPHAEGGGWDAQGSPDLSGRSDIGSFNLVAEPVGRALDYVGGGINAAYDYAGKGLTALREGQEANRARAGQFNLATAYAYSNPQPATGGSFTPIARSQPEASTRPDPSASAPYGYTAGPEHIPPAGPIPETSPQQMANIQRQLAEQQKEIDRTGGVMVPMTGGGSYFLRRPGSEATERAPVDNRILRSQQYEDTSSAPGASSYPGMDVINGTAMTHSTFAPQGRYDRIVSLGVGREGEMYREQQAGERQAARDAAELARARMQESGAMDRARLQEQGATERTKISTTGRQEKPFAVPEGSEIFDPEAGVYVKRPEAELSQHISSLARIKQPQQQFDYLDQIDDPNTKAAVWAQLPPEVQAQLKKEYERRKKLMAGTK